MTGAYAHVHALRDPGLFVLSRDREGARCRARASARSSSRRSRSSTSLRPGELDNARIAAEAGFVRQLETAQGRARTLGWNATVAGDPQFAHVYLDRIRAVRRHDVARVMRRYLRPENATRGGDPADGTRSAPRRAFARQAEIRVRKARRDDRAAAAAVEKRVVLPSGMVLIVRRDPSVPVVAMRAVWRGGQRIEDAEHAGASTLLARMLTRGCGGSMPRAFADSHRCARRLARRRRRPQQLRRRRRVARAQLARRASTCSPTASSRRRCPARARAREAPAARRSGRAARQPCASRVPAVHRNAVRRSPVRARRARHRALDRGAVARRARRVLRGAVSGLADDARDRRRRRHRRHDRARHEAVRRA